MESTFSDQMWLGRTAVVAGFLGGLLGVVSGVLELVFVVVGSEFVDPPLYVGILLLVGAPVGIVGGAAALVAAGRASVRPSASVRIQLVTGLAALPLGWGVLLLVAARAGRRAARAGDRTPTGARVAATSLAFALIGATGALGESAVRLALAPLAGASELSYADPYLAVALLGTAGATQIWRRPLLAALLEIAAGA